MSTTTPTRKARTARKAASARKLTLTFPDGAPEAVATFCRDWTLATAAVDGARRLDDDALRTWAGDRAPLSDDGEPMPEPSADDEARIARDERGYTDAERGLSPAERRKLRREARNAAAAASNASTTAEQRAASMPADALPPVPDGGYVPHVTSTSATPAARTRRAGTLSRIVAGRLRSRTTAHVYAVDYDPAVRFPALAGNVARLRAAMAGLDTYVDAVIAGKAVSDADLTAAQGRIMREAYEAWTAGLPTTAIGSIIGTSGGAARGLARKYARRNPSVAAPVGRRSRSTRERAATPPERVAIRYADALADVYADAIDPEADASMLDASMSDAYRSGVPIGLVARVAGLPTSAVRKRVTALHERNGLTLPTKDELKAARSALALPELPDD